MIVIAFANPKGGTGKTTSALLLAEQFSRSSNKLAILDCDPNQNLHAWLEERNKSDKRTSFDILPRPKEEEIVELIDDLEGKYDYLIVDLEGTASQTVTYALSRADLVIIPLEPNSVEARHAARAVQLVIRTGRMLKRDIPYSLLFTRTNAAFATREEKEIRAETASSGINVLPTSIVKRSAYTKIFGDYALLSELRDEAKGDKEKEQIQKAILNSHDFGKSVANMLQGRAQ